METEKLEKKSKASLLKNFMKLAKEPTTIAAITHNQQLRKESVENYKCFHVKLTIEDVEAAQKFWCMQAYYFIRCLYLNKDLIAKYVPDLSKIEKFSQKNLPDILEKIIKKINEESLTEQTIQNIIAIFVSSNATLPEKKEKSKAKEKEKEKGTETELAREKKEKKLERLDSACPSLYVTMQDSIKFAYQQAVQNNKVLIMDAANSQNPGAGAYQHGTFQEALTCYTDLFWKILIDFRDVLKELKLKGKAAVKTDADYKEINVTDFQARFFKLILTFIKKSIEDDDYLSAKNFQKFRVDFFKCEKGIFNAIQNCVLEIDDGFLKEVCIVDIDRFQKYKKPVDLFNKEGIFQEDLLKEILPRVFIAEVAAPDRRDFPGKFDRNCTFNKDLQICTQGENPRKMIERAFTYTINQTISKDFNSVIFNGFGCKAFKNPAPLVADIFSTILLKNQINLIGRSIHFIDVSSAMCKEFGKFFCENLRIKFDINPYFQGKIKVNVLLAGLNEESLPRKDNIAVIASTTGTLAKKFVTKSSSKSDTATPSSKSVIPSSFFSVAKPKEKDSTMFLGIDDIKTKITDKAALKKDILEKLVSAADQGKTIICMPLIGAPGSTKLNPLAKNIKALQVNSQNSIEATQEALKEFSEKVDSSKSQLQVYIYILPDDIENYHTVVKCLKKSGLLPTIPAEPSPTSTPENPEMLLYL